MPINDMTYVADVAGGREQPPAEADARANVHRVVVDAADMASCARTLYALAK